MAHANTDGKLESKVMSAAEAVKRFIGPGTHLCPCGFSYTRRPFTLIREIIRQQVKDLFVTVNGGGLAEEVLAGAGLVKMMDTTYIGLEGLQPVANSIRRGLQDGEIELLEDYSNWGMAQRTLAGRFGMPFAPLIAELGSDILEYDVFGKAGLRGRKPNGEWIHPGIPPKKFAVIDDPFEGWGLRPHQFRTGPDTCGSETNAYADKGIRPTKYTGKEGVKVVLVPPMLPEVVIVRAQRVGVDGTIRFDGILGPDVEQVCAGRIVIAECERVTEFDELREQPHMNHVGAHFVTAVVEQPWGGYPSIVPDYYDYDWKWIVDYGKTNRKPKEEVRAYWRQYVADTKDEWDFLSNKVGWDRLYSLRADPHYHYRPNLDRPL